MAAHDHKENIVRKLRDYGGGHYRDGLYHCGPTIQFAPVIGDANKMQLIAAFYRLAIAVEFFNAKRPVKFRMFDDGDAAPVSRPPIIVASLIHARLNQVALPRSPPDEYRINFVSSAADNGLDAV